jgi:GNAT superfamily N-acetyltransferase
MITLADPGDRDVVVATVVDAFRRDPAFTWFFPHDYDRQAAAFAGLLFDTRAPASSVWVADGGAAVAMWDRPRAVDAGREDDLEGALARSLSPDALARIARYEDVVDALLPREPHWYLGILAIHPDRAGRRLGRTVGRVGLEEAVRVGVPAALETTNPGNVERYEAEGWVVTAEVDIDGLHVWVLRHDGVD